jgi:hypothetical protein
VGQQEVSATSLGVARGEAREQASLEVSCIGRQWSGPVVSRRVVASRRVEVVAEVWSSLEAKQQWGPIGGVEVAAGVLIGNKALGSSGGELNRQGGPLGGGKSYVAASMSGQWWELERVGC